MGLVTYTINEKQLVETTNLVDSHPALKTIMEEKIIPLLCKYDNISYIGKYEEPDNRKVKYILDIGYDNIAYFFYVYDLYVLAGICDKKDTNSFGYLKGNLTATDVNYQRFPCSTKNISDEYYVVFDGVIRVLAHGNEAKVIIAPSRADVVPYRKVIMDVDSFGNKYVAYSDLSSSDILSMYYDTDDLIEGSVATSTTKNALDMQVLIGQPSLIKSSVFTGLGTNLIDIKNNAIESELTLIDVEGVRYRNIVKYRWYKEEE